MQENLDLTDDPRPWSQRMPSWVLHPLAAVRPYLAPVKHPRQQMNPRMIERISSKDSDSRASSFLEGSSRSAGDAEL